MASIALRRVNGKMLYIAEMSEIPVGNKAYRSILMENNVTVKMRFAFFKICFLFGIKLNNSAKSALAHRAESRIFIGAHAAILCRSEDPFR